MEPAPRCPEADQFLVDYARRRLERSASTSPSTKRYSMPSFSIQHLFLRRPQPSSSTPAAAQRPPPRPPRPNLDNHVVQQLADKETLPVKKWDGTARQAYEWDNLRRDPELWQPNGNCSVHLYAKGQSRRGPAFRITFPTIFVAKCTPLLERFADHTPAETPLPLTASGNDFTTRGLATFQQYLRPNRNIDLYIPAPAGADKSESFRYHLATRNFFAFLCRRSMAGDHLGGSLVGLLNSMHEFRDSSVDNVADLMEYLTEEGYVDMRDQPSHALAILYFAETFQLRSLYINAFAHCVGMIDRLPLSSEYQFISDDSRRLIRLGGADLDQRITRASEMLRNFLADPFSEANLGLSTGARIHFDRFRSFLVSFYSGRFGTFPPRVPDSRSRFQKEAIDVLREDFENLYVFLVDKDFTCANSTPFLAQGNPCVVQSVHSFDLRCNYPSLEHPIPLLPEVTPLPSVTKRLSWLGRSDKLRPDQRLLSHAALIRASNTSDLNVLQNPLVKAYRTFEEEAAIFPSRLDRKESVSLVEARKVRWILIYGIYQVLISVTDVPREVKHSKDLAYHVAVSTANLPPWGDSHSPSSLARRQTYWAKNPAVTLPTFASEQTRPIEIKPNVDHLALNPRSKKKDEVGDAIPRPVSRTMSLTRSISRHGVVRRSIRMFRPGSVVAKPTISAPMSPRVATPSPSHHEILVEGYGNGTNTAAYKHAASPTSSTASERSSRPSSEFDGNSVGTCDTSPFPSSPDTVFGPGSWNSIKNIANDDDALERKSYEVQERPHSPGVGVPPLRIPPRSPSRPHSGIPAVGSMRSSLTRSRSQSDYARVYSMIIEQQLARLDEDSAEPEPLRILKGVPENQGRFTVPRDPNAWVALEQEVEEEDNRNSESS